MSPYLTARTCGVCWTTWVLRCEHPPRVYSGTCADTEGLKNKQILRVAGNTVKEYYILLEQTFAQSLHFFFFDSSIQADLRVTGSGRWSPNLSGHLLPRWPVWEWAPALRTQIRKAMVPTLILGTTSLQPTHITNKKKSTCVFNYTEY